MADGPLVYLVAAEPSGDTLGAELMEALAAETGGAARFRAVGGTRMAARGAPSLFDIADLSVLGFVEGLAAYPRVVRRAEAAARDIVERVPDAVVLIDSWGFTLRVAQRVRRRAPGVKLVKYVGPQVWATRPGRARTLAAAVDRLLAIHPFDAPIFESAGLPTTFVGNPALWRGADAGDGPAFRARVGVDPGVTLLLVLFGSRGSELGLLFAPFEDAVRRLRAAHPELALAVPVARSVEAALRPRLAASNVLSDAAVVEEDARNDAFAAADAAIACSGTVTSELALAGVPTVVGYRLAPLTHVIARRLMRAPYASLVNIAAGEALLPEFIQDACDGPRLAEAAARFLDDAGLRAERGRRLSETARLMKGEGEPPSRRAARAVLAEIG